MSVPLRDKTPRGWHPEPNRMMSLAEHAQPAHRHAGLARAGQLWVGVQAKDWTAYLIRPGNTVTTQVEYEGVLRSCERLAEDNPYSDRPFLVDGFWWLGIRDAHRVLRDGEMEVHFLYPPEPTVLHQQWPEVFPDADFLVMLGEKKKIQKADLLWLADAPGLTLLIPYEQAFARLNARFNTTPGEVVMWISHSYPFEDGNGRTDRLPAFRLPILLENPRLNDWEAVHGTAFLTGDTITGLSKLDDLFFPPEALESFTPAVRWLTYQQLAARWGGDETRIADYIERMGNNPMAFWAYPTRTNAALHECMFMVEQIERVETVFGLRPLAAPATENSLTEDAPADTRVAPLVRPRRSTPATEVAALTYNILNGRDGQPPSADAAFNYLLRGEFRAAEPAREKELANWVISTDANKGIMQIVGGGEVTREQFKRTFNALIDDKAQ